MRFEFANYWKCKPYGFIHVLEFKFDSGEKYWMAGIVILNFGFYLKSKREYFN